MEEIEEEKPPVLPMILSHDEREKFLSSSEQFKIKSWTGYMCFVVFNRPKLRKENPDVQPRDILKLANDKWNAQTKEEKGLWGNEAIEANRRRELDAKENPNKVAAKGGAKGKKSTENPEEGTKASAKKKSAAAKKGKHKGKDSKKKKKDNNKKKKKKKKDKKVKTVKKVESEKEDEEDAEAEGEVEGDADADEKAEADESHENDDQHEESPVKEEESEEQ